MRVGLLTYHADFATSEYYARAITGAGHELRRIGLRHPERPNPASSPRLLQQETEKVDRLLFVDPPGPAWPSGLESVPAPTTAYLIDVHVGLIERLRFAQFFDLVFVAQRDYLKDFHARGFAAEWLPLACDPTLHAIAASRTTDVAFVGKAGSRGSRRHALVRDVLSRFETNDTARWYTPTDMARTYSAAKIVFNASINGDLNMRFFEGLASGALLVTDRIDNGVSTLFEDGVHYVAYESAEDAVDKIRFYLANGAARERIARAGQAEVLANHTYARRFARLMERVDSLGARRPAPIRDANRVERDRAYASVFEQQRLPAAVWGLLAADAGAPRGELLAAWARTLARKANARVPLTAGAVRARLLDR